MGGLTLSLVTPEKPVWEGGVDSVTAPAVKGPLGILPGHIPLLAQLIPGLLRFDAGGESRHLAVSGGFLEVARGGRVSVFAETAEMADEIDAERARQAAEKARALLRHTPAEVLDEQALAALERATLRLRVAHYARRRRAPG
jgi:F-type H+-transporting ATPase subunit epsilon